MRTLPDALRHCWSLRQAYGSCVRRLDRVQPRLEAVDGLARVGEIGRVDARARALALDVRDGERLPDEQVPVDDAERVAVEAANRRAGRAVALRVVLAAVAGAAEAG